MRERPWRKLRVVVEVSVPPTSRATEKDLAYHVESHLPKLIPLRRAMHDDARYAKPHVKIFSRFWPWFLRKEKGLSIRKKKDTSTHDPDNGL
jgi:hypothetical protein